MEKTKIFISYNNKDEKFLEILLKVIDSSKFKDFLEPIYDNILANDPNNLHGNISKLLNKSHVAVAILTNNWLKSNNTRDEFIRANERRKKLYCIIKSDDLIDEKQIPHYIKGDLRFEFNSENFEQIAYRLCNSILNFNNHWQLKLFDKLRLLGDHFENEGNKEIPAPFTIKHFEQKMFSTEKEMSQIVKNQFAVNVSYEQNFLEAAKPYFESATKIFAVSLITVSTFWTDNNTPIGIKHSYLKAHDGEDKKVVRIFVFTNPSEANKYKNVLQANYKFYGQKKGNSVLFCSLTSYKYFLNRTFFDDKDFHSNWEYKDFGFLFYEDEINTIHEALLENGKMLMKEIDLNSPENYTRRLFLNNISENIEDLEKIGIYQWNQNFYDSKDIWAETLKKVFGNDFVIHKEVIHMIFFKIQNDKYDEFQMLISELLSLIESKKNELNIKSFYFRNKTKNSDDIKDGRTNGKLNFNKNFNYSLSIVFNNNKSLEMYYSDLIHSDLRRKLYVLMNPSVLKEYSQIDELIKLKTKLDFEDDESEIDWKINQIYKEIENEMANKFIIRFDWENNITYDRIASTHGYNFLGYDK